MNPIIPLLLAVSIQFTPTVQSNAQPASPWNTKTKLNSYRLLQPVQGSKPEFIDLDNDKAKDLVFNRGKWKEVWLVYDEDDDCERWERVELPDPEDPYTVGARKGGLDDNTQSDPVGDRGEWELDNSGNGNLNMSPLDGKIHLFGAETGYWRVDQKLITTREWVDYMMVTVLYGLLPTQRSSH